MTWLIPSETKLKELKKQGKLPAKNIRIGDCLYDGSGKVSTYSNGRQKTTSYPTGTKILKEALQQKALYDANKLTQKETGIVEKPFITAYTDLLKSNSEISQSTVVRYNNLLNNFIDNPDAPVVGFCDRDILCSEVTPELVNDFRAWCTEQVKITKHAGQVVTTRRLADKTVSMVIARIKAVLAYANKQRYVDIDFDLSEIKNIPKSKQRTKDVRAFTDEELKLFFNDNNLHPNLWFLYYGLLSLGCRVGQKKPGDTVDDEHEARKIRWKDIDVNWDEAEEFLNPESGKVGTIRIWGKKTNKYRFVPISRDFFTYLYEEYKKRGVDNRDGYLFIMEKGGPLDYNGVYNSLQAACKRNNIDGVSTHSFRHTFIQRCLLAGINFRTVMKWSGHADIKTFMVYLESIDAKNDSINEVDYLFLKQ